VFLTRLSCALIALLTICAPALAQESFWRGKTISLYVGGTAGSGVDVASRVIAKYMTRHMPGNPAISVQVMPGAGGIRLLDHLRTAAPKDGTALGTIPPGTLLEPLTGARKAAYSMTDFNAIGAAGKDVSLCIASTDSGFTTIDQVKQKQMVVAGTGAGANPDTYPLILNEVLGTKFKLITGYVGTQETSMAIERGEADGRCGWSWASIKATRPAWVRDHKISYLLQFALKKNADFPDTPLALDFVTREEDRQLLTLLFAPLDLSKPFLAPPGVPAERIAELRKAFMDTMNDEDYRTEAVKLSDEPVDPTEGAEMQKLIAAIYATPAPVVDRLRGMLAR
jgi:tripartite-type tricarboxylate transporter receptor subunit TctC